MKLEHLYYYKAAPEMMIDGIISSARNGTLDIFKTTKNNDQRRKFISDLFLQLKIAENVLPEELKKEIISLVEKLRAIEINEMRNRAVKNEVNSKYRFIPKLDLDSRNRIELLKQFDVFANKKLISKEGCKITDISNKKQVKWSIFSGFNYPIPKELLEWQKMEEEDSYEEISSKKKKKVKSKKREKLEKKEEDPIPPQTQLETQLLLPRKLKQNVIYVDDY